MIFDGDETLYNMPEKELHNYFYETVKDDFFTAHEVSGICKVDIPGFMNKEVIADFLLYPRQHLIDAGFADTWFGVEIKRGKQQAADGACQAFWYNLSKFEIKGKIITPGFSLYYKPSHFKDFKTYHSYLNPPPWKSDKPDDIETIKECYFNGGFKKGYEAAANLSSQTTDNVWWLRFNVGQIKLNIRKYAIWQIIFQPGESYAIRRAADRKFPDHTDTLCVNNSKRKQFSIPVGNNCRENTHSGMFGQYSNA